ncbi:MAG: hypothetical protein IJQ21_07705, partial [Lachnospiraceae bacterium]|nr:hypothetical protein [Lachnospiraceae bacterium]
MSRILFISGKKSMIANALIDGLSAANFEVIQVKSNVTEISRVAGAQDAPEIWILFLQGTENLMKDVLSYIRDRIDEHNIRFFVIGTQDELDEILKDFPPNLLKAAFTR